MKRYLQRFALVVLGLCFMASPAFAQQWDFENGLGNWNLNADQGGTIATVDTLGNSGTHSVMITTEGSTQAAFVNNTYKDIAEGDTLHFMVYVSVEDTVGITGIQPFVQYKDDWSGWADHWYNGSDLQPGSWNHLYLVVPADVAGQTIQRLGIQINAASADNTVTMFVDDASTVPYGSGGGGEVTAKQWDFEDGMGDWGVNTSGDGGITELVDTLAYSGTHSVYVSNADGKQGVEFKNDVYKEWANGDTLYLKIYIAEKDTANLLGLQPYFQINSGWSWKDQWYDLGTLKVNTWNTVTMAVPEGTETVQRFGVKLNSKAADAKTAMFVDLISTAPYDEGGQGGGGTLKAPTNLAVDSTGTNTVYLSWFASAGSASEYHVYRGTSSNFEIGTDNMVGTTSDTVFTDTSVMSKSTYYYKVTALGSDQTETEATAAVTAATKAFAHYSTWDFENGKLGIWSANDDAANDIGGSISVVDTTAFSGHYAIKAVKAADRSKVHVKTESTDDLIAGQTIYYRVYVPEGASAIDSFQPFLQYNSWAVWDGESVMAADLEAGAWNTLSIKVPDAKPFDRMGLEIKYSAAEGPAVLVDLITTDPTEMGIPDMPAPANLSRGMFSQTSVNLSWDAVEGAAGYKVYQSTEEGAALDDMKVAGSTGASKTSLSVSPLYSETTYYFKVTAKDDAGRETMPSGELKFKTTSFSSHQYWDFEDSEEVVFNTSPSNSATGTIARTDSMAYSGSHSLKISTGATETFVVLDAPEFPGTSIGMVAPGRWLRFNIWVAAEDTAGLMAFTPYFQDGNWGWNDAWYDISSIEPDQWNTLEIFIPNNTDGLNRIGLDIRGKDGNPNADIFIDMVTTDPYPRLIWSAGAPTELSATTTEENTVALSWTSPSEEAVEYNVYRGGQDAQSMSDMKMIGSSTTTTYTDTPEEDGTYNYAVTALDAEGRETEASAWVNVTYTPLEKVVGVPNTFELSDNYPNPFNPTTQIRYQVAQTSMVSIKVYNITGRLVQTLVNESRTPGTYTVSFRAANLSSGIYLYRMQAGSFNKVKQMMLIK